MTQRNFGVSPPYHHNILLNPGERFPDGCDWHKPPGCDCRSLRERDACEHYCEDVPTLDKRLHDRKVRRWLAVLFLLFVLGTIVSMVRAANSEEAHKLPPLIVEAPRVPYYCRPLMKFERTCDGVKTAARALGVSHALWLAKRCGATNEELAQARACFDPK